MKQQIIATLGLFVLGAGGRLFEQLTYLGRRLWHAIS